MSAQGQTVAVEGMSIQSGSSSSAGAGGGNAGEGNGGNNGTDPGQEQVLEPYRRGDSFTHVKAPVLHPFDTRAFVNRLEEAGFVRSAELPSGVKGKGKGAEREGDEEEQPMGFEEQTESQAEARTTALSRLRNRDPAQAIMEALREELVEKGGTMLQRALNTTDLENVSECCQEADADKKA